MKLINPFVEFIILQFFLQYEEYTASFFARPVVFHSRTVLNLKKTACQE